MHREQEREQLKHLQLLYQIKQLQRVNYGNV
jgi:hypothetical protein